jgi:hypothetical protein
MRGAVKKPAAQSTGSPSGPIDQRIRDLDDWQGEMLSRIDERALEALVRSAVALNTSRSA